MASTTLKMVLLTPIPSATHRMTMAANPGCLAMVRHGVPHVLQQGFHRSLSRPTRRRAARSIWASLGR